MRVGTPEWNSADQYYSFPVTSDFTRTSFGSEPVLRFIDVSGVYLQFIQETASYFMTPLSLNRFRKVTHELTFSDEGEPKTLTKHEIDWELSEIRVHASKIQILWSPRAHRPLLTVPPGFLDDDVEEYASVPAPPQATPIKAVPRTTSDTPAGGILADEILDAADSIPFHTPQPVVSTAEVAQQRTAAKRRVREARLRVAMARLRAERLAKRFLERYGDLTLGEEADSGLSSESELEGVAYPKNIGSH